MCCLGAVTQLAKSPWVVSLPFWLAWKIDNPHQATKNNKKKKKKHIAIELSILQSSTLPLIHPFHYVSVRLLLSIHTIHTSDDLTTIFFSFPFKKKESFRHFWGILGTILNWENRPFFACWALYSVGLYLQRTVHIYLCLCLIWTIEIM